MNAAANALNAAKTTGDLGRIGDAIKKLQDAVNAYLTLTGTTTPSAGTRANPPTGG